MSERRPMQRLRFGVHALAVQEQAQVADRARHLGGRVAPDRAPNGERLAVERLRLVVLIPLLEQHREVLDRLSGSGVPVAQEPTSEVQGLTEERLRLVVAVELRQRGAEEIARGRHPGVRDAMERDALHHRLAQQRRGFVVEAKTGIDPAEHAPQLRLHFGLPRKRGVDPTGAALEQLARGHVAAIRGLQAVRVGAVEDADQKLLHLSRLPRLGFRLPAQHHLPARGHGQRGDKQGRQPDGDAMATDELAESVARAVGSRMDRLAAAIPLDILRQCGRRLVSPPLFLLQGGQDDEIEIAAQRPAPLGRGLGRWPRRRIDADDALDLRWRPPAKGVRPLAGEQPVQQDAERVHVGRRAHRLATNLLGRRELGGHRAEERSGLVRRGRPQQFRDPEVEQLRLPVRGHEDVGGLEVAMDHQPAVGVRHGLAHPAEQREAFIEGEPASLAVRVDRLALDQLHREVREAARGQASVHQAGDSRVLEQRQDAPLFDEATEDARRPVLDQLDGDPLLEVSVGPLAEEDAAHAAASDLAHHTERADPLRHGAGERGARIEQRRGHAGGRRVEQAVRLTIGPNQLEHLGAQRLVVAAFPGDERRLLVGRDVECRVEDPVHAVEPVVSAKDGGHPAPSVPTCR